MTIERKIIGFDMKSASDDGSIWDGHGNAFHTIDSAQEIVVPGAFTDTLGQFLVDGFIGGLNHNWDDPIGKPTDAKEDRVGLWLSTLCDVDSNEARKCRSLIKKKIIKKLSIGYRVKGSEWLETAEDVAAYWKQQGYTPSVEDIAAAQYGARLLTKIHLYEVSPVTVPANSLSDIGTVKRYTASEINTERDFERFLRDAGFPKQAAVMITASGYKALHRRDAEETPPDPDNAPTPDEPEVKTEPASPQDPPTEIPAVVFVAPVEVPVVKVSQSEIRDLYAKHLNRTAAAVSAR